MAEELAARAIALAETSSHNPERPITPEPLGTSTRPSKYYALHSAKSATSSPEMSKAVVRVSALPTTPSKTRPDKATVTNQAASGADPVVAQPNGDSNAAAAAAAAASPGQERRSTTGHVIKSALQNPTRKRRKDTWIYAQVEEEPSGDGIERDSRGVLTIEDEFKLAARKAAEDQSSKRPARRSLPAISYNENKRPKLHQIVPASGRKKAKIDKSFSVQALKPRTAVEEPPRVETEGGSAKEVSDLDRKIDQSVQDHEELKQVTDAQRSESGLSRVGLVARATANAMAASVSTLGKRSRDAFEGIAGRRQSTLDSFIRPRSKETPSPKKIKPAPASARPATRSSPGGRHAGIRASSRLKDSPLKRARESVARLSQPVTANAPPKEKELKPVLPIVLKKKWLSAGLYLGQDPDFDVRLTDAANMAKKVGKEKADLAKGSSNILPQPMFSGKKILELGRNFRLPFDVYSPLMERQPKPDEWKKTRGNIFIGDSASVWKKTKSLPDSCCLCTRDNGCDENCLNRLMFYECDDKNCLLGREHCGNRAFADLKDRVKSGKKYNIGVEVVKTEQKGFGVRANRTFEPNQIIVEYSGEIITQDECERRMLNEYKKNECYYLMIFHQNMIIDATRGSMARFVNHSCEPNCRMVKWTVAGEPRMALFAGDHGIMTGQELTYDYNFDPFSQKNVQTCHCGTASCRGVLGPKLSKPAAETIIAGTKRKLSELVGSKSKSKVKKQQTQDKKKIAVTMTKKKQLKATVGNKLKPKLSKKRVSSSDSEKTLIGKENMSMTSSRASTASTGSTGPKPSQSRRKTIEVLSRTASKLKVASKGASKPQALKARQTNLSRSTLKSDSAVIIKPGELSKVLSKVSQQTKARKSPVNGRVKKLPGSLAVTKLRLTGTV